MTANSNLTLILGHPLLFKTILKADSYVKNNFQLVEKLKRLYITGEHKLISLDVISLFTNVPIEIAVDSHLFLFTLKNLSDPIQKRHLSIVLMKWVNIRCTKKF